MATESGTSGEPWSLWYVSDTGDILPAGSAPSEEVASGWCWEFMQRFSVGAAWAIHRATHRAVAPERIWALSRLSTTGR